MTDIVIREITEDELGALSDHVVDHLRDNGTTAPLFQPLSRSAVWPKEEREAVHREGLARRVGEPKWRRFWVAVNSDEKWIGHVDLRGHAQPSSSHRTLLGMGVDRDARRQGIGSRMVDHALAWASQQPVLEWMDLEVLATNEPAIALYQKKGFETTGTVRDMFRIDGESIDSISMSRRIRD